MLIKSNVRRIRGLLICSSFAFSLSSGAVTTEPPQVSTESSSPSDIDDWTISSRLFVSSPLAKEWLLEKKVNGKWAVVSTASKTNEAVESILVDINTKTLYLNVEPSRTSLFRRGEGNYKPDQCSFGVLGMTKGPGGEVRSNDRKIVGLNVCNSSFTKSDSKTTAGAVVGAISLMYGSRVTQMAVSTNEIRAAIIESGLISEIQKTRFIDYREAFQKASTIILLDAFISQYSQFDPDGLLAQAIQRRENLVRVESESRQAERQRLIAENATMVRTQNARNLFFQKNLKPEGETNCGLVLELKGTLAKVYFPMKSFGNEHWVKIENLYESGSRTCELLERLR